jgi:hypothetical protein
MRLRCPSLLTTLSSIVETLCLTSSIKLVGQFLLSSPRYKHTLLLRRLSSLNLLFLLNNMPLCVMALLPCVRLSLNVSIIYAVIVFFAT